VQKSILSSFPDADIAVSIVWIDMLETDNAAAARRAAGMMRDARVMHFHDPNQHAGQAVAQSLMPESDHAAWDIYLFYAPNAVWNALPPTPVDWMHQLSDAKDLFPQHHRTGQALVQSLDAAMTRLFPPSTQRR
jgi:hypothetical protein